MTASPQSREEGGRGTSPRARTSVGDAISVDASSTYEAARLGSDGLRDAMVRAYHARAERDGTTIYDAALAMLGRAA